MVLTRLILFAWKPIKTKVASSSPLSRHSWNGWSVCATLNRKANPNWSSSRTIRGASSATSFSISCTAKTKTLKRSSIGPNSCVRNWLSSKWNSSAGWTFSHAFGGILQGLWFVGRGTRLVSPLPRPTRPPNVCGALPNKHNITTQTAETKNVTPLIGGTTVITQSTALTF